MQIDCRFNRVARIEIGGKIYLNYSGTILTNKDVLINPIGHLVCNEIGDDTNGSLFAQVPGVVIVVSDVYHSFKKFERGDLISVSMFKQLTA